MRWLLNTWPTWSLALLFVGGLVALAVAGFLFFRLTGLRSPNTGADTFVAAFSTRATTIFGILLVFVIVAQYGSLRDTQASVRREATSIAQIIRDSGAFPPDHRRAIRRASVAYANAVVDDEWRTLRDGHGSPLAFAALVRLQQEVQRYEPEGATASAFYGEAVDELNDVVDARRERIGDAQETIPAPLLALVFAGAVVFVLTMVPFSAVKDPLLLPLVMLMAALGGAGLLATVLLDFPFSGPLTVSTEPFREGVLAALVRP